MNINEHVKDHLNKYQAFELSGRLTKKNEISALNRKVKRKVPSWFIDLLENTTLAEMDFGIPFNYGWAILKDLPQDAMPLMNTYFCSLAQINWIATEEFPGLEMIKKKYICIAPTDTEDGDGFYLDMSRLNGQVIYVYHDFGQNAKELIQNAPLISDSFTEFIELIRPHEQIDQWASRHGIELNKE